MDAALIGRDSEFAALTASVEKGRGAVLTGPAGIGKTRLVLEATSGSSRQPWWMAVTADSASIPYGPFYPLSTGLQEALTTGGRTQALAHIRQAFLEGSTPSVLVVDDAHHLDPSSAAAIHALARAGDVPVVATLRDGERVPDSITALWKDVGLTRMEIGALARADADALALALIGGPAERRTLSQIWKMSRGHPLEMRELIQSARESGNLALIDDMWTIGGSIEATSRLVELVEERLRRLADAERQAAETLAYGEPIDLRLLIEANSPEAVERLERSDIVRVVTSATSVAIATFTHPLYGEVLRAILPATRRATIATDLERAATTGGIGGTDPLRLTAWRLESGRATAEELEAAAINAVRLMAWDLALRFGKASLHLAQSYMGHGCVAAALAELGDPDQAEQHLLQARELVDDPAKLAWNTISIADVWFYHGGRMGDALELVRKEVARTTEPEIRDDLVSALAINLMMYGSVAEVADLAREVLDSPDPSTSARLMALVASASADGLRLIPGSARAAIEAAMPLIEENRHRFANAEDILHLALCGAELADGDLIAARTVVDQRLDLALESDSGDLPGLWTMNRGLILLYEGAAKASCETQLEAMLLLARYDSWLSSPLAKIGAAHAAAVMADAAEARRHLAAIAPEMRQTPRLRSRIGHVEALLTAMHGGLTAGAAAALAAGDHAADDDHLIWAVEAWHLAVRLGKPETVELRLANTAAQRPGTIASLYHSHAVAILNEDPEALQTAIRNFKQAGFALFAAEAACQLSDLHRRRQEANLAKRAATVARELIPANSGVKTPSFALLPEVVPLTSREREVALLAASGLTSKDIADRLFISTRSVDNHLSRVYTKLGVSRRSELPGLLLPDH